MNQLDLILYATGIDSLGVSWETFLQDSLIVTKEKQPSDKYKWIWILLVIIFSVVVVLAGMLLGVNGN